MSTALVIEDNATLADLFRKVLGQVAIEATAVGTCKDALSYLSEKLPELVLLDLSLPDGSGVDVITYIRQSYTSGRTRIIVISGNYPLTQSLNLETIDFVLYKPVSPSLLLHTLKHLPPRHEFKPDNSTTSEEQTPDTI